MKMETSMMCVCVGVYGKFFVVHSGKHSHPNKYFYIMLWHIIPINVSVFDWYKQMLQIIFPK